MEGSIKRLEQGAVLSIWKKNEKTATTSFRDRRMVSTFLNKNIFSNLHVF